MEQTSNQYNTPLCGYCVGTTVSILGVVNLRTCKQGYDTTIHPGQIPTECWIGTYRSDILSIYRRKLIAKQHFNMLF